MSSRTSKPGLKAKRSYTLSVESVTFLEHLRKKQRARSTSSVLDDIVRAFRRSQRRRTLAREVSEYYSSLTPAERQEEAAWGELASAEFAKNKH
jgi:hypothetical protein